MFMLMMMARVVMMCVMSDEESNFDKLQSTPCTCSVMTIDHYCHIDDDDDEVDDDGDNRSND